MTQTRHNVVRRMALATGLAACAALAGCASTPAANPKDPFEGFNRAMFTFNDKVDQVALKPAATAYKKVTPEFVQTGVNNFFSNLGDLWTGVNNLLQGKPKEGFSDFGRFGLNSTVGMLGFFDPASTAGLSKHREDFGQTLGVWGVSSGPYLMLPILGPSTVRDTAALPLDWQGDPWSYKDPVNWRNAGTALRIVDQRAVLLDASNLMEEAALDRYEFMRDGFLQRRDGQVNDGNSDKNDEDKQDNEQAPTEAPAATGEKPVQTDVEARPAEGAPAVPAEKATENPSEKK
ncbi:MAG TPA: VacJ family lipoprotein [Telluria sp.]|nr:VacJ family lipoprotein [Telluria sp.]